MSLSHLLQNPISKSSKPLQKLNLSLKKFHQYTSPSPKPSLNPQNLQTHKDWLSQSQILYLFSNLENPNLTLKLYQNLSTRKDFIPNLPLYTTLIHNLSISKNFDAIESLMLSIKLDKKTRLTDTFFRNLIKIYGHSGGRIDKAVETLFDMPSYNVWPSVKTFNFVLNLLVTSKQFEMVYGVFVDGALKLGVEIDCCCLNIVIKGLCECGKVEEAFKVVDEFSVMKCRPNVRTFSTIMHGLCKVGRVDEAFELLGRMDREGVEVDAVVFNILIAGLRRRGRGEEGVEVFDGILRRGCDPNPGTYQEVLYCYLDGKRFCEAKEFMGRMMIEKRVNPSFESFKMLIKGFCEERNGGDVEWGLARMVEVGFVPKMGMWKQIVEMVVRDDKCGSKDVLSGIISRDEVQGN